MQIEPFLLPWQRRGDITGCERNIKLGFTFSRLKGRKKKEVLLRRRRRRHRAFPPRRGPNKRRLSHWTFSQGEEGDGAFVRVPPGGEGGEGEGGRGEFHWVFVWAQRWSSFFLFLGSTHHNLGPGTTAGLGVNACLARARVRTAESDLFVEPVPGFCWLCCVF